MLLLVVSVCCIVNYSWHHEREKIVAMPSAPGDFGNKLRNWLTNMQKHILASLLLPETSRSLEVFFLFVHGPGHPSCCKRNLSVWSMGLYFRKHIINALLAIDISYWVIRNLIFYWNISSLKFWIMLYNRLSNLWKYLNKF